MNDSTNVVGRLANTSNSSGGSTDGKATAATFSYDPMGRIVRKWEQTPSTSPGGSFVYQSYDLAGDLTSLSNGSGVTISYAYDSAARTKTVTSNWNDAQHPGTLYTVDPSIGYFPSGAIRKATLPNLLTEIAMYNNRLQPCRMEINSTTSASFVQCTDGVLTGNVLDFTYGYNSGSANNGNVATWSAVGNQTFTRSYGYDSLNRISTLSDTATAQACKGLSWTIDPWGNRTDQNVTAGTCGTFHAIVGTNNRFGSPYQYDAAGNVTYDGIHTYTYDAENHLTQVDAGATASYIYDPSGNRVRKNSGGSWTEYFYDMSGGNVTAEHNSAGWPVEYVYVRGQLIAQYRDSTTYSIFRDHLGSTRLITKLDKTIYDSLDFLPFGEQLTGDTRTTHKFTGKERDSESGLDNFGARYDSSSMGRFMSPDSGIFYVGNPQSLNRYAFVMNNPLRFIDPDGNQVMDIGTYVMTQYQQVSPETGTMDWLWAAGMAVGGRGVESGPWMKTIGRDQAENAIRILSAEHPVDNTSGAWFTESHSLWSVSVDFRVDPGAGTTASISFVSNPNGVIAAPNTSFRFNGMGEVAAGGFQFNLTTLTNEQVNALYAEATVRERETHDLRYIEILLAVEQEQRRREEEQRKKEEKERQKKELVKDYQ
jgi:RHS repeat-associated protein